MGGDIVAPTTFQEIGIETIPGYTLVGLSARYEIHFLPLKSAFLQLNVDNLTNDRDLYGQIYATGLSARLTYQIGF